MRADYSELEGSSAFAGLPLPVVAVVAAAAAMARTLAINELEVIPPTELAAAVEPALAVEPAAPPVAAAEPAPPLVAAAEPPPRLALLIGFSASPSVACETFPATITTNTKYRLRPPLLLPWSQSDLCHDLLMSYLCYY